MRIGVQKTFVFKKIVYSQTDTGKPKVIPNAILTIGPNPKKKKDTIGIVSIGERQWELPSKKEIPYTPPLDLLKKIIQEHPSEKAPRLAGQEDYSKEITRINYWPLLWKQVGIPDKNVEQKEQLIKEFKSIKMIAKNRDQIKNLIQQAIDFDFKEFLSGYPLVNAIRHKDETIIMMILEVKPNINKAYGLAQDTPLHKAVKFSLIKVVEKLIELGAKKNIRNKRGETPLDIARRRGYTKIAELLK
jgi:hypothetical protein